ncbi:HepT-like ribonuclease domain-containing protein [Salinibacter ruber]|uniref:HepT-like ribonuclease domain-containing protein n=1 Tax=Salinibacter ruber TaxID=146919 RepID=UPI002168D909|nr:HepT-like ribonuclease domain-containing protein [Salinibacter ruber]MCS3783598.1 uncharacterized protein with HEPN domain [Salinibacter ruber]
MSADETNELYLEHIRERIGRIEACAQEGREAFSASPILQDAVMRNFEVIGEAVKQRSPDLRDQYASVEWRRAAGVRDVLIQNYMGVDLDEVWNGIEKDLPRLKRTVTAMLDDMNG